jgi:hypothetical protein
MAVSFDTEIHLWAFVYFCVFTYPVDKLCVHAVGVNRPEMEVFVIELD